MRQLWIVKTGSTFPSLAAQRGDYEDWIVDAMQVPRERVRVADVRDACPLPEPDALAGAVVTGSSAMVSAREDWSERAGAWLAQVARAGVPVLGICYGHQLLAHALGGRVGPNPRGREVGTVRVRRAPEAGDDPLLGALPEAFEVHATHVESVLELPRGAVGLAASDADPHHAFAAGRRCWGVQFHPEFDADVMRTYLEERRATLAREGIDADALRGEVRESPHGGALLRRFAELLAV